MKNLFLNPKNIIFLGVLFLTIGLAFASSYNVRTPDNLPKIEKEKTLFILDFSNSMNETLRGRKKSPLC